MALLILKCKQQHEGHHETEQTHGLGQGESQDGIGKQLLLESWITRIANNQAAKNCSNTSTSSGDSDGGSTSSNIFGS